MNPLVLILVSAAVHALVNILTKSAHDKYAMRLLIGVFSALFVAPALLFVPLPRGIAVWLSSRPPLCTPSTSFFW